MIADPAYFIPLLILGAFVAAFVSGAIGFADALIMNSVWLHIMDPIAAIPLVVTCGIFMHFTPLYKLRSTLDFSRLMPFVVFGLLAVPIGAYALGYASPDLFKKTVAVLLIFYGIWMVFRPNTHIGEIGGKVADSIVGFVGGFMGGFAGLSGLTPTIWSGVRGWPRNTQRGVYQPFVVVIHALTIATFAIKGMITGPTLINLAWCIPAIFVGSWLGVKIYPYLNDHLFKQIILGLIFLSGITLLV
ncbi:MAG: sulfite exporter TauE/SafE family protein [Hyphomicrobiales bacterium]|nr:sulfite exporter TauE/SafE family protein [Hyphomicrobiales bacterium]